MISTLRPFPHPALPPLSPLDNILASIFQDIPHALLDFPPSPCSSVSTDTAPSPQPHAIRVVCDVPLLAPRPLPYHSPTFLQFDLPDTDEDLSHPPYTHRPAKRKRDTTDDPALVQPQSKRRLRRSRPPTRPWPSPPSPPHRSGNHRPRP